MGKKMDRAGSFTREPRTDGELRSGARLPSRFSSVALFTFGFASFFLTAAVWTWSPIQPLFDPRSSALLAACALLFHFVICGRRLGSFDPGIWVPVLFFLHYFGMTIAIELIGSSSFYTYDAWGMGLPRVEQGFAAALLTLVAFLFGFHLVPLADMASSPQIPLSDERSIRSAGHLLLWGGLAMIGIGIPLVGASIVFGHYGEMKETMKFGLADFRLIGAGFIFAVAGVCAVLSSATRAGSPSVVWGVAGSVLIFIFLVLTGDRTGMSTLAFGGGWVFTQRIKKVPRWFVVAGFILMFLISPMIKEYRVWKNLEETSTLTLSDLAASTFYEMGSSVQVFSWTLEEIPANKPYDWGMSVVAQTLEIIPNFGLRVGERLIRFDPLEHRPSKWITWVANPVKYAVAGGGYGFAVGAEWYFNFGFPGLLFGMMFLGWLTAYTRNHSRDSSWRLLMATLMFIFMVNVVRNSLGYPLRSTAWPLVAFLILARFIPSVIGRRPRPEQPHLQASASSYDPQFR